MTEKGGCPEFESLVAHQSLKLVEGKHTSSLFEPSFLRRCSVMANASAFQAEDCGFESRHLLQSFCHDESL